MTFAMIERWRDLLYCWLYRHPIGDPYFYWVTHRDGQTIEWCRCGARTRVTP